eukprot:scaffold12677_cov63-Cyclotella_meneghiniana.AAC.8
MIGFDGVAEAAAAGSRFVCFLLGAGVTLVTSSLTCGGSVVVMMYPFYLIETLLFRHFYWKAAAIYWGRVFIICEN